MRDEGQLVSNDSEAVIAEANSITEVVEAVSAVEGCAC